MSNAEQLIWDLFVFMPDTWKNHPFKSRHGPGQVVLNLSDEKRRTLRRLKSGDLNIRSDIIQNMLTTVKMSPRS